MTRPMTVSAYPDNTGIAPRERLWCALDDATYNGEPCDIVGWGATEAEALADWDAQFACAECEA